MKVFISINGLKCGGAEKSLISFLNEIPDDYIKEKQLEVDLLVLDKKEYFFTNVPKWINWMSTDCFIDGMFETVKEHFANPISPYVFVRKIGSKIKMKLFKTPNSSNVQHIWNCWKSVIPEQKKHYDLAISYVDGFSNYYVTEKVNADKKILWVHNEYEKLNYDSRFDDKYFSNADAIVTISDRCKDSLIDHFPHLKDKIWVIPNISSPNNIWKMSEETIPEEFSKEFSIVSIGRLNEQKGFDLAIDSAEILSKSIEFKWYILGEGELRNELQERIDSKNLNDFVILLGNRNNPYPYIKKANVFVQPSRYEGKSIVLDEAKILERPIIITNYATAYDSISDGKNGYIVEFEAEKLADKILSLLHDETKQLEFCENLRKERLSSKKDINRYLELINTICCL